MRRKRLLTYNLYEVKNGLRTRVYVIYSITPLLLFGSVFKKRLYTQIIYNYYGMLIPNRIWAVMLVFECGLAQ